MRLLTTSLSYVFLVLHRVTSACVGGFLCGSAAMLPWRQVRLLHGAAVLLGGPVLGEVNNAVRARLCVAELVTKTLTGSLHCEVMKWK